MRNLFKRIKSILLCYLLAGGVGLYADASVPQIILIQNSGWMLPFYEDTNSNFKNVVIELSTRLSGYGSEQVIASFNQTSGANKSPLLHYKGNDKEKIKATVEGIQVAHKPGSKTYTDTDFKEAIIGAISQFSPGKPCIVWIVTNNKNSPNNSVETIAKNKDFYKFLQGTDEIKRIVAFPHLLPARSKSIPEYRANGLMFYALAYGEQADQVLQRMLGANVPFGKQSARLKPLNSEALTFIPKGVKNKDVEVRLAPDKKTLIMTFSADSKPEVAELIGSFQNNFYPYDIKSAKVEVNVKGFQIQGKEKISVELSTRNISSIPAGGFSPELGVKIKVPAIPSAWDLDVILSSGYNSRGLIQFELEDQQLVITENFTKLMSDLFPNDPLPDLFMPSESARRSVTNQNIIIEVKYPSWPLFILGVGALTILGLGAGCFILLGREKIFRVSVDGFQKTYCLRPFSEVILKSQNGDRVGVLRRRLGQAIPVLNKSKNMVVRVM